MPKKPQEIPEDEPCAFDGCERGGRRILGLCNGHWSQQHRGEELRPLRDYSFGTRQVAEVPLATAMYLAGLLEGEGCFLWGKQGPRVKVQMTDRDVVVAAREMVGGVGSITIKTDPRSNRKTAYCWEVSGSRAIALMTLVLPHMGTRRSDKIKEILYAQNLKNIFNKRARAEKVPA